MHPVRHNRIPLSEPILPSNPQPPETEGLATGMCHKNVSGFQQSGEMWQKKLTSFLDCLTSQEFVDTSFEIYYPIVFYTNILNDLNKSN